MALEGQEGWRSGAHLYPKPAGFRPLKGKGSPVARALWEGRLPRTTLASAAIRRVMRVMRPPGTKVKERDCRLKVIPSGFVRLQPLPLVKPQNVNQALLAQLYDAVLRHRRSRLTPYWAAIAQKVEPSARQLWTGIRKV